MRAIQRRDSGGQTTVGVVLVIGLVVAGSTVVVALGNQALDDMQENSELARAEQSMTQFDSQAAQVALGDSSVQTTQFGRIDGAFQVRPSTGASPGRITVTHVNFNGDGDDDGNEVDDGSTDDDQEIYSAPLGAVVYETRGTEIAYQGGGVWRKGRNGEARMVSPPEFHYRVGTLTLPIIRTDGSGAVSGDVTATTRQTTDTDRIFPDAGRTYTSDDSYDGDPYLNAISEGYVVVTVESRYYEGWANYFRSRTDGTVTVDDANEEAKLELDTLGLTGQFGMPSDPSNGGSSLQVQGMEDGHSLSDFTFTIYPKDDQESAFNNLRWSMYADEGNQKFEIALKANSADCGDAVPLAIYYSGDGHTSYQGWTGSETVQCSDVDGDGDDERFLDVDLVDLGTPDQDLTYEKVQGSQLAHFKNDFSQNDIQDPGTLPGHDEGDHSDRSYAEGTTDAEVVDFVVAHYFAELAPDFELRVEDQQGGAGAGVDEDLSTGYIDYTGGGQVVTYLHITENRIEIDLE